MQKLLLAEDVFDALEEGKLTTIRKGRRNITLGDLLFESVDNKREKIVNVDSVQYCLLAGVDIKDVKNDGFEDHFDMLRQMKRFYHDITLESEVTVVRFI